MARALAALPLILCAASCASNEEARYAIIYPWNLVKPTGQPCVDWLQLPRVNGVILGPYRPKAPTFGCIEAARNNLPSHPKTIIITGPGPRGPANNPPGPPPPIAEITGPPRSIAITSGVNFMINPGKLSVQQRIDRDCMAYVSRRGIQAKFHTTMYKDHSAKVRRSDWDSATQPDRNQLIWDIAIHNSCVERKPDLLTIRIRDEAGHLLRTQRVSTALDCHGDFATEYPGRIWYRC